MHVEVRLNTPCEQGGLRRDEATPGTSPVDVAKTTDLVSPLAEPLLYSGPRGKRARMERDIIRSRPATSAGIVRELSRPGTSAGIGRDKEDSVQRANEHEAAGVAVNDLHGRASVLWGSWADAWADDMTVAERAGMLGLRDGGRNLTECLLMAHLYDQSVLIMHGGEVSVCF
jgi:hypothetical protein